MILTIATNMHRADKLSYMNWLNLSLRLKANGASTFVIKL